MPAYTNARSYGPAAPLNGYFLLHCPSCLLLFSSAGLLQERENLARCCVGWKCVTGLQANYLFPSISQHLDRDRTDANPLNANTHREAESSSKELLALLNKAEYRVSSVQGV